MGIQGLTELNVKENTGKNNLYELQRHWITPGRRYYGVVGRFIWLIISSTFLGIVYLRVNKSICKIKIKYTSTVYRHTKLCGTVSPVEAFEYIIEDSGGFVSLRMWSMCSPLSPPYSPILLIEKLPEGHLCTIFVSICAALQVGL